MILSNVKIVDRSQSNILHASNIIFSVASNGSNDAMAVEASSNFCIPSTFLLRLIILKILSKDILNCSVKKLWNITKQVPVPVSSVVPT